MTTISDLEKIRQETLEKVKLRSDRKGTRIVVGMATCGIAAGATPVMIALVEEVGKRNLQDVIIIQTGCIGACRLEPIVEIYTEGEEKVTYVAMTAEKARMIITEHIVNGNVVHDYTIGAYTK
ncbi:NAD(P)-dependent iron-only hydrogenase iron-sulfur protein [Clostridium aceticum]|uniref:NAD(P)-dependent iron-only hydrogenase iron-sulfur protein n=1 Tax=Clostridium aceticum TaxID=84022 RepID=A0A0D8IBM3_9CLOT|nr:(2Fe-2S) ferredoxin domain-containing protein [Clostridium aceticum]AKL96718.1 NAD(P)-dependent iron-only hydrogenase iron-sulfur protein [Clostridium aceticum]KJF27489.1 ferredoxin [Clostridium aceticum]